MSWTKVSPPPAALVPLAGGLVSLSRASWAGAEGRLWGIPAGVVARWVCLVLRLRHIGRLPAAPQGLVCNSGAGCLSTPWSPSAVQVLGGLANGPPGSINQPQGCADRLGQAVVGRTAVGGSLVGRRGSPQRRVACAGAAKGWCPPLASGTPWWLGTASAGTPWPCMGRLVLADGGSGSSRCGACAGRAGCGEWHVVPPPVQPAQVARGVGPRVCHKAGGHIAPWAEVLHGRGWGMPPLSVVENDVRHGAGAVHDVLHSL